MLMPVCGKWERQQGGAATDTALHHNYHFLLVVVIISPQARFWNLFLPLCLPHIVFMRRWEGGQDLHSTGVARCGRGWATITLSWPHYPGRGHRCQPLSHYQTISAHFLIEIHRLIMSFTTCMLLTDTGWEFFSNMCNINSNPSCHRQNG